MNYIQEQLVNQKIKAVYMVRAWSDADYRVTDEPLVECGSYDEALEHISSQGKVDYRYTITKMYQPKY